MRVVEQLPSDVIARWTPVLFIHPSDTYMPVPFEYFIQRGCLRYHAHKVTDPLSVEVAPPGQVTQELLLEVQQKYEPRKLSLHLDRAHWHGSDRTALADVPIYAHCKLVEDDSGQPEAYEINYITMYAFNGHYDLAGLGLCHAGDHVGDLEHMTVRLDAATLELQGVWYNAHRNIEGEWAAAADVPRTRDGRIIAYVALHGHGTYPQAGRIWRLFGVANDHTSGDGPVWRPKRVHLMCGLEHGNKCVVVPTRGSSLPPTAPTTPHPRNAQAPHPQLFVSQKHGSNNASAPRDISDQFTDLRVASAEPAQPDEASTAGAAATCAASSLSAAVADADSTPPRQPVVTASACAGAAHEVPAAASPTAVADTAARAGPGAGAGPGPGCCARQVEEVGLSHEHEQRCLASGVEHSAPHTPNTSAAAAAAAQAHAGSSAAPDSALPSMHLQLQAPQQHDGMAATTTDRAHDDDSLPVVVEDASLWQRYMGHWGTAPAAQRQCWFYAAEPPVSRGALRRICLPLAKGVEKLPPSTATKSTKHQPQSAPVLVPAGVAPEPGPPGSGSGSGSRQAGQGAGSVAPAAVRQASLAAAAVGHALSELPDKAAGAFKGLVRTVRSGRARG